MDTVAETVKDVPRESIGFIKHMVDLEEEGKNELMNMVQYALLSIVPVIVILKVENISHQM